MCQAALALLACAVLGTVFAAGCEAGRPRWAAREASRLYPPPPQVPRVIALGNLRGTPAPTRAETELALFLFGAEPMPSLAIATPAGLAAHAGELLICDMTLGAVLRWDPSTGRFSDESFSPPLTNPFAIAFTPNGQRLVCDRGGVRRFDAAGQMQCSYALPSGDFKPGGVAAVGDQVWVSNLAAHCVEVFDATSGQHVCSIGAHGRGPGQFALPRGLARCPDGNVCVVDMLNNRVQVLDPNGKWLRDIGQPGDNVGSFGRPKDVAVGPDGTIFVIDAFSQRVHAFSPDGQPLLAFGEPGSGIGELVLPSGITIMSTLPPTERPLPPDSAPAYYLLVAEALNRPGIRVYGWLDGPPPPAPPPPLLTGEAVNWRPTFPGSTAINPHWDAQRCTACHKSEGGRLLLIKPETSDALCLSCHDGVKAPADPHPIGRPAVTDLVDTPTDWPTIGGAIGCLTCHDIRRHCSPSAQRPAINTVLLRGFDPQRPLEYCSNCHRADVSGRFSPHRQRDATGRVREDACMFCHTQRPEVPADGRRRFQPHLRVESSELCLNCHTRHWDLSPLGHVERPVTPRIRQWMLMRELSLTNHVDPQQLARLAEEPGRHPARLPLGEGRVTCYTCHNPHYTGLFPPNSELSALARNPQDRASALRTDWIDLCSECHHR